MCTRMPSTLLAGLMNCSQGLQNNGERDYDYEQEHDYGLGQGGPMLNSGLQGGRRGDGIGWRDRDASIRLRTLPSPP